MLKGMGKKEWMAYIDGVLTVDGERLRFDMSGYEADNNDDGFTVESCSVRNQEILNKFAYLGIYDYNRYLSLDFHKGGGLCITGNGYLGGETTLIGEYCGEGTREIIYEIILHTFLSRKDKRRRH